MNYVYLWLIALVAALGGLLFGYDWVVIGGAKPFYEKFFGLVAERDVIWTSWAMSCALVGCLVGAALAGSLSDRFGRKRLLIAAALLFAVSSVGTGWANTFTTFVGWRIAGGVAIGLASSLSPLYIAEIAPASLRGTLVAVNQLTIVIGILLAQLMNWLIAETVPPGATAQQILESWNGQVGWRWMFAATAVPAVAFLVGAFFVPESPRWLARSGRPQKARAVLARIGGDEYAVAAMAEIQGTVMDARDQVSLRELFAPRMARVLVLGVVLAVFQQWCGINVIFNYAEEVFSAAGYQVSEILLNIVGTGGVNLVFTLVAIVAVDRLGRRALMLAGTAGLVIIYLALSACYLGNIQGLPVLVLVLSAIGCYAVSLAPVTWVVIAEIFPNRIRGAAMSVAVMALWIACFSVTASFPLLNARFGPGVTFRIYAIICLAGLGFIAFCLPETKGKTLEQIERELVGGE